MAAPEARSAAAALPDIGVTQGRAPSVLPAALPGIDVAAALQRCRGNDALLRQLLLRFRSAHAQAAIEMQRLHAGGNLDQLAFLAHTIKGAAGHLGGDTLARAAAAIETAVRENKVDALAGRIDVFASALAVIVDGLALLEANPVEVMPEQERESAADGAATLHLLLLDLAQCLQGNDTRADALIAQLRALFARGEPAWLATIADAVSALDYERARAALPALPRS